MHCPRKPKHPSEVVVGRLEVVPTGHLFGVPQPRGDDVSREPVRQFCLAGTSQVVHQPGPRGQTSPPDDLFKLRPQVGRSPAILAHDVFRSLGGRVECRFEVWGQLREQRDEPLPFAGQESRLRRGHPHPPLIPVDIRPLEGERLRWTSQATDALLVDLGWSKT